LEDVLCLPDAVSPLDSLPPIQTCEKCTWAAKLLLKVDLPFYWEKFWGIYC